VTVVERESFGRVRILSNSSQNAFLEEKSLSTEGRILACFLRDDPQHRADREWLRPIKMTENKTDCKLRWRLTNCPWLVFPRLKPVQCAEMSLLPRRNHHAHMKFPGGHEHETGLTVATWNKPH
jgi:hypothetical protein